MSADPMRLWRLLVHYPMGWRLPLPFGGLLGLTPCADPDCRFVAVDVIRSDWRSLALLGAGFLVVAVMVLAAVVVLALVIAGKRS